MRLGDDGRFVQAIIRHEWGLKWLQFTYSDRDLRDPLFLEASIKSANRCVKPPACRGTKILLRPTRSV